jgi:small subunit ribosomal protein S20
MPTHKSAKKRQIQNVKKNAANREARSTIRTAVKATLELTTKGDKENAVAAAKAATRLLDKAVNKGLVHKNNAARRISRLNAKVASIG